MWGRERQGRVEKAIWHGVRGKWNKERWEPEKEPRNFVLLLIRFTVRNFS